MRLIDADEAIRRAKEPSFFDLTDVPDFLAGCPTVNLAGQWISTKDRLPEDGKNVLIFTDKNGGAYSFGVVRCNSPIGSFWATNGAMLPYNVTHWMPLPTPPTKEEHI